MQDYFVYDDLPQFIMVPYDDCRDPPRLHLLDKYIYTPYSFVFGIFSVSVIADYLRLFSGLI